MMPDKKKVATIIVSHMNEGGMSEAAPEDGGGDDLHSLAEDFLHAVSTKSAMAVADAFRAMFMCLDQEEDSEEGEE